MKKVYLFGALLLAGTTVIGQSNTEPYTFGVLKSPVSPNPNPVENTYRPTSKADDRALNILWTEDFDGSGALTTNNGMWTTAGSEASYWALTTSATTPLGYPNNMDGRHLLWDSRTPVSAIEPTGSFATTPVEGSAITPVIDLTGYTNVTLQFDMNGRYCCNAEPWTVAVSNDNGATWGAEIPMDIGLDDNVTTNDIAEPYRFSVNISQYLDPVGANNNDVKLRFTWTGLDANGAGQTSSYYSWEIDDIVLYEIPAYEIAQEALWLQDISVDYEYTNFPANQASTLTVQAPLSNNGLNAPSNLAMEVTLIDAGNSSVIAGPVSGGTLTVGSLNASEMDTITFATAIDLSALAPGEYRVQSIITYTETDEIPENDTLVRTFRITTNSMGHMNYDANPIVPFQNITADAFKTGALFTVQQDVELHGFDFFLPASGGTSQQTTVDVPVVIWIHDRTNDAELGFFTYELTADKLGGWYTFNFYQADPDNSDPAPPIVLESDIVYAVTMESFSTPFWYQASIADADFSGAFYFSSDDTWYWNGDEPWVMLNFDESLTVNENVINQTITVSQNQPNPFNDNTIITYNLNQTADVSVEVVDLTGKVVATYNEGVQGAGQYKLNISAENLSGGVYFYNFKAGNYSVTKRMVVSK
ncbi:MAG: T9SS type A sorting domain-containing protein [Putridiphycobacter sp.]|nr:T9SS type A sorting domain-containing protein [Putridiphycobacter sp.]